MNREGQAGMCRLAMVILSVLFIGCQSLPTGRAGSVDIDAAMPGAMAQERYAHVSAALQQLDAALAPRNVSLAGIALDVGRQAGPHGASSSRGISASEGLTLAENAMFDTGPYQLVHADTLTGRLEYRTASTGRHVAVFVRAPDSQERESGQAFIVTEIIGQDLLSRLLNASEQQADAQAGIGTASPVRVHTEIGGADAAVLARLDSLPWIERDREDLLGLRAMLMMRLDKDEQALPLVQQGIVRYPESPLFFSLAGLLFERADPSQEKMPETLTTITEQRFTKREILSSRREVEQFLTAAQPL